jgi:hypothetical protein
MSDLHQKRRLALRSFKPMHKGTLVGFAQITLPVGGFDLEIDDIVIGRSGDRWWASLPGKPMIGPAGEPVRNEETGKPAYSTFLRWGDKHQREAFSAAVVNLIRAHHPDALN